MRGSCEGAQNSVIVSHYCYYVFLLGFWAERKINPLNLIYVNGYFFLGCGEVWQEPRTGPEKVSGSSRDLPGWHRGLPSFCVFACLPLLPLLTQLFFSDTCHEGCCGPISLLPLGSSTHYHLNLPSLFSLRKRIHPSF